MNNLVESYLSLKLFGVGPVTFLDSAGIFATKLDAKIATANCSVSLCHCIASLTLFASPIETGGGFSNLHPILAEYCILKTLLLEKNKQITIMQYRNYTVKH